MNSIESRSICRDGGYGWVVVMASFFSHMLNDGIIYSFGVLAPEFITHFGISRSTVGWLGSILAAVTLGAGLPASYLCDRFSYRTVAIVGSVISAVGFGAPYFYSELWFLIISSSLICGIGFGLVYLPSIMIVNVSFEKKRPLAIGFAVCGSGFGTFLFSPLLEYLILKFEWQLTMLITGGILLLLVPCSLTYVTGFKRKGSQEHKISGNEIELEMTTLKRKNDTVEIEDNSENINGIDTLNQSKALCVINKGDEKFSFASRLAIMSNVFFILFLTSNVLSSIGFNAPYMFAKDRAMQLGINATKSSYLISSMGIGNCIGRIGFGVIGTLQFANRFHLFNFSLILSGLVLILSWIMNLYSLMLTYTLLYGVMSGGIITLTPLILIDMFDLKTLDITFGVTLVFQAIAVLIGPPVVGSIFDVSGSYNIAFLFCGLCFGISGLIMYLAYVSGEFRKKSFSG